MTERFRGLKAVVFDAVGTLIYPQPSAAAVYTQVGHRHGSRLEEGEIEVRFASALAREEELDGAHGFRTSQQREIDRWHCIVVRVLDDAANPDACFTELFAHFATAAAWRSDADAKPVIARLCRAGLEVGIGSNFDSRLRQVVGGLDELAQIDYLIISAEVGWRKPAREFFQAVCRIIGASPAQILYVGNDPVSDVQAAKSAGLQSLLFDPQNRHASQERITSLVDLAGLLELPGP
jgi:putative hydrolase of the HAD superfamily